MIDPGKLTSLMLLVGSLVAVWVAFYYVYLPAVTAKFRQDLFEIRRDLFRLVVNGRISPSHPAYTRVRMTCNGLLRFADRVELFRMLGPVPELPGPSWQEHLDTVDDAEVREMLTNLRGRVGFTTFAFMVFRSPFLLVLLLLSTGVVMMVNAIGGKPRNLQKDAADRTTPIAEAISLDPCDAPATT